jgi:hypothetical protein
MLLLLLLLLLREVRRCPGRERGDRRDHNTELDRAKK